MKRLRPGGRFSRQARIAQARVPDCRWRCRSGRRTHSHPTKRCMVHKCRNLLANAPERLHDEILADHIDMIYADTPQEIETRRKAFLRKWRPRHAAVANSLEEAGDRLHPYHAAAQEPSPLRCIGEPAQCLQNVMRSRPALPTAGASHFTTSAVRDYFGTRCPETCTLMSFRSRTARAVALGEITEALIF